MICPSDAPIPGGRSRSRVGIRTLLLASLLAAAMNGPLGRAAAQQRGFEPIGSVGGPNGAVRALAADGELLVTGRGAVLMIHSAGGP